MLDFCILAVSVSVKSCLSISHIICCHLVAFLSRPVVPVGVGEMDVTRCDLHHLFDVPTTFTNHMGVLCVGHVHL